MYKYSVGSRIWILFILISPFWARVTLCEQLGSAPLGLQASAQGEDPFLHLYPFHWKASYCSTKTALREDPRMGAEQGEGEKGDFLLASSVPASGALSLQKEHHSSHS